MLSLVAAILVAAAVVWGSLRVAAALHAATADAGRNRALEVLKVFAPAAAAAAGDPRAILAWEPLARTARTLFPEQLAAIDRARGAPFPFGTEKIQAAHAQWTADWLVWERAHDAEYKLKTAVIEEELSRSDGSPALRARADLIEREKLELYQRRYQEYVRVAKALQALAQAP